jgi:hypothetical protein
MKRIAGVLLKVGATLLASIVAFCMGAYAGAFYCDHWVMPGLEKQYPHDGQLGLTIAAYAISSGLFAVFLILVAGIVWIVKTSRRGPALELPDSTGS